MIKDHLIEVLDNSGKVIEALADNKILKSIALVGDAIKVIELATDIRDRIFSAKMLKFLTSIEKVSKKAKDKIRIKVVNNPKEAQKLGKTILLLIERMSEIDKAEVLARLFIAYIEGKLTFVEFRRVSNAVDQEFLDDVHKLIKRHDLIKQKPSKEPFMQFLAITGLTELEKRVLDISKGQPRYEITQLGEMLINAYYYSKDTINPQRYRPPCMGARGRTHRSALTILSTPTGNFRSL